jgi:exoribonuclease-2
LLSTITHIQRRRTVGLRIWSRSVLIKAALAEKPAPYSDDALSAIAARCTEREDAANKVEREVRKAAAALVLQDRIGEMFDAVVTGASPKGTFVRLKHPIVDGKLDTRGQPAVQVGDRVRVRLTRVQPLRGFIDFALESNADS